MRAMATPRSSVGIVILVLMLAATVLSVIFATRGAMAGNRPIIEVLHFVGAEDGFIAGEFQRHFLLLGLKAAPSAAAAAMALFALAGSPAGSRAPRGGDQTAALFGILFDRLGRLCRARRQSC